jgi:hypothetical protein
MPFTENQETFYRENFEGKTMLLGAVKDILKKGVMDGKLIEQEGHELFISMGLYALIHRTSR